jgi:hypothetical protein
MGEGVGRRHAGFPVAAMVSESVDSGSSYASLGAGVGAWAGTAILGAIVGAVVGSQTRSGRWKEVDP